MTRHDDGTNRNNASNGKGTSHSSHPIIPPPGDYQTLLSYQNAEVIYDITFRFAHRYLSKGDRTVDQMIQSCPLRETAHSRRQQSCAYLQGSHVRPATGPKSFAHWKRISSIRAVCTSGMFKARLAQRNQPRS